MLWFALLFILLPIFTQANTSRTIRIGGMFPIIHYNKTADNEGIQLLSTFLLAIADMSKKTNYSIEYIISNNGYTFIENIQSCLTISTSFDGYGPHITVGGKRNNITENICKGLQDLNVLNVIYGADSSSIGDNNNYYSYLRVYPNIARQGYVIADTLGSYYKYNRIVVIYSTDDYGLFSYNMFLLRAIQLDLNILKTIQITIGQTSDFSYQITAVAKYDPRIFVILSSDVESTTLFIKLAFYVGLLNKNSMTWVSDTMIENSMTDIIRYFDSKEEMENIFSSISLFAVGVAKNDWKITTLGKNLIRKIQQLPPTKQICETTTDYNGNHIYYINSTSCADVVFSSITANEISSFVGYVYDATTSAINNVINYCNKTHNGKIPRTINNQLLRHFAVYNNTIEEGITGAVEYSDYIEHMSNYGMGGRSHGISYEIYNYYNVSFRRIGIWTETSGFELCSHTANDSIIGDCYIIYYGKTNIIPSDHAADIIIVAPLWNKHFVYVLVGIELISIFFMTVIFLYYRKNRILKISQYPILCIILFSAFFNCGRIFLASLENDDLICVLRYWFGHLNILPIICFLVKTARVYYIINSSFKKVKINIYFTLCVIAALFSVVIFILSCATAFSAPRKIINITTDITGQHTISSLCITPNIGWDISLYVYDILLLLISLKLCNDVKNIPDVINESKYISYIIYLLSGVSGIGFFVIYFFNQYSYMNEFILTICFFISQTSIFYIYFGYKVKLLLSGMDINKQMQLVSTKTLLRLNSDSSVSNSEKIAKDQKLVDEYMKQLPKTIYEYRKLIEIFQQRIVDLNLRFEDSSLNHSSLSESKHDKNKPPIPVLNTAISNKICV